MIDKNTATNYNLPQNMINKTFAEASKKANKIAKERPNDPISRDTKKAYMDTLIQANDEVKAVVEAQQQEQQFKDGGRLLMALGASPNMMMEYAMGGKLYGSGDPLQLANNINMPAEEPPVWDLPGRGINWLGEQYQENAPDWLKSGIGAVGSAYDYVDTAGGLIPEYNKPLIGGVAPTPAGIGKTAKGAKAVKAVEELNGTAAKMAAERELVTTFGGKTPSIKLNTPKTKITNLREGLDDAQLPSRQVINGKTVTIAPTASAPLLTPSQQNAAQWTGAGLLGAGAIGGAGYAMLGDGTKPQGSVVMDNLAPSITPQAAQSSAPERPIEVGSPNSAKMQLYAASKEYAKPSTSTDIDFDSFFGAIGGQESGGNYNARNKDSGAFGKYQIMPENWPKWAKEAGLSSMADQSPENQEKVARFKLKQYYDRYGPKGAAIAWYAGPGAVDYSDEALNRKQGVGGRYPSIGEYADQILGRVGKNYKPKTPSSTTTNAQTNVPAFVPDNDFTINDKSLLGTPINNNATTDKEVAQMIAANDKESGNTRGDTTMQDWTSSPAGDQKKDWWKDSKNLRYAPIAFDALAAAFGKNPKPKEYEPTLIQQPGKLKAQQFDMEQARRGVDQAYQTGINSLAGASGGSGAAMRAGLTGLGAGYSQGLGAAYLSSQERNAQNQQGVDQFNLQNQQQIAGANAQLMNQAGIYNNQMLNQNQAQNYDNRMSYLGKGAEGLGDIGYEERNRELMPKMFGYSDLLKYMADNKSYGGKIRLSARKSRK